MIEEDVRVIISMVVICHGIVSVEYDRRRLGISSAPFKYGMYNSSME